MSWDNSLLSETGHIKRIPKSERLCSNRGVDEDELHVLESCKKSERPMAMAKLHVEGLLCAAGFMTHHDLVERTSLAHALQSVGKANVKARRLVRQEVLRPLLMLLLRPLRLLLCFGHPRTGTTTTVFPCNSIFLLATNSDFVVWQKLMQL